MNEYTSKAIASVAVGLAVAVAVFATHEILALLGLGVIPVVYRYGE